MARLDGIEGVSPKELEKLHRAGIETTDDLLAKAATAGARAALEARTGIREDILLRAFRRADLGRVTGVTDEMADLLTVAGVTSAAELATRDPAQLKMTIKHLNTERRRVSRLPTERQLRTMIGLAQNLPRVDPRGQ